MKTTRRRLLGLLGLGAAAAALAPVASVGAADTAPKTHPHFEGDGCPLDLGPIAIHPKSVTATTGNLTVSSNVTLSAEPLGPYTLTVQNRGTGGTLRRIQPGETVDPAEIQQIADLLNGYTKMEIRLS